MVDLFDNIIIAVSKLNKNILPEQYIKMQIDNTLEFRKEQDIFLLLINKLKNMNPKLIEKAVKFKQSNEVGPVTSILLELHQSGQDYFWHFNSMKKFLNPLVKYYKQKNKHGKRCAKENISLNPILLHHKNNYIRNVNEFGILIKLFSQYNNTLEELGKNRILSTEDLEFGYNLALELSAMNYDIQVLLYKLSQISANDICHIDPILRELYGKLSICAKNIDLITDNLTRKMAAYYPDWDHVVDGVPYT
ncbi:MAG TPA: hypothetical protein PKD74_04650 [Candidatus Dependentiae bacterium]|nr:hypothetical protein [Candidatus Dependentiae bacterium]